MRKGQKLTFKTPWKIIKEAKELEIYKEYNELIKEPGAMATAVDTHLAGKYGFGSETTIWVIRRRVEKRLKEEEESKS
ncbi:MAG: hypothetical protein LBU51_02890 [Bacteroidales bacterium]|jgi:hypothetical protein|nr:hypothetical protein [Bacteroidales bacterium]